MDLNRVAKKASDYVGVSRTLADWIDDLNEAVLETVSWIIRADPRWKWDDFNHSDMNIFFETLVNGQQDYEVSGAEFLTITEVAVKLKDGRYKVLDPVVRQGKDKKRLARIEDGDSGIPREYELMGNSLFLYPAANISEVSPVEGLRVTGQRLPVVFTAGDGDKSPGINPLFHKVIPVLMALEYAYENDMNNKINLLQPRRDKFEMQIQDSYASRHRDDEPQMGMEQNNVGGLKSMTSASGHDNPEW